MNAELTPATVAIGDLDAFWMPFTANRQFKANPRLLARAKGMYYWTTRRPRSPRRGRGSVVRERRSWPARNHRGGRPSSSSTMEFAPTFQMGHPIAFELANRLAKIAPPGLDRIFFTNSGSESVDTALKIAIAYHRSRGDWPAHPLDRPREGISRRGLRRHIGRRHGQQSKVLRLLDAARRGSSAPHAELEHNAFSRGLPQWGMHLANELERLIALHDASTIAAVIVEPISGSAGVVLPPSGYLKRLREICDKHEILLIFDEVITGFGRVGKPFASAGFRRDAGPHDHGKGIDERRHSDGRGVFPAQDLRRLHAGAREFAIELFHGYTYSAHPVACAAALATQDIYAKEGLLTRAATLAARNGRTPCIRCAACRMCIDIRNYGLIGAVEWKPRQGKPGARGFDVFLKCFERGVMVRQTGDTIAMSPPLIIDSKQIDAARGDLGRGDSRNG